MSTPPRPPGEQHEPGEYEIRIAGLIAPRWSERFDGLRLTHAADGTTTIHGPVMDQAALHGLLRGVRDLGLPLLSVRRVEPGEAQEPTLDDDPR